MRRTSFIVSASLTLAAAACARPATDAGDAVHLPADASAVRYPATIVTPQGVTIAIARRPERVVALALDGAETASTLLAPQGISRLIAVPRLAWSPGISSMVPTAQRIGTVARADAEYVLSLKPDLVIAGILTDPGALAGIAANRIPIVRIVAYESVADIFDNIRLIAWALDERARAETLIGRMHATMAQARRGLRPDAVGMRVMYLAPGYFTWGRRTCDGAKLTLAGVRNAAADAGLVGDGPVSAESIVAINPAGILVRTGLPVDAGLRRHVLADPQLRAVSAIRAGRVASVLARDAMAVSTYFAQSVTAIVDAINRL